MRRLIAALRWRGFDVMTVQEVGRIGFSDKVFLSLVTQRSVEK
jgi:hypothetical protein